MDDEEFGLYSGLYKGIVQKNYTCVHNPNQELDESSLTVPNPA